MKRKEMSVNRQFQLIVHGWVFAEEVGLRQRIQYAETLDQTQLSADNKDTLAKMRQDLKKKENRNEL